MNLTKNEKRILKLLLKNAKISDSSIATKLKISSQAVGKIRKKLEKELIESYTTNLNYPKLGIKTFAISLSKLTSEGMDKGELEVEEKLLTEPHIIQVYRLPSGNYTHLITYGFQDIDELDSFFHSKNKKQQIHKFIENKELFTFSNHSLIKNDPSQIFFELLENSKDKNEKKQIEELYNFKKKIE